MITRRGFLGVLLGAATVVAFPFRWACRKISPSTGVFCNAQLGSDLNDGLTPETAVQSTQAALDRLPKAVGGTTHLSGTFYLPDSGVVGKSKGGMSSRGMGVRDGPPDKIE